MKQRKKLASIVGICWILSVLWWCQQTTETAEPTNIIEVTEPTIQIEDPATDETTMNETNIQQQLVINPGCIGCGHCVMAAPSNFAMNGRQAQVISQENLNSPAIQQAMMRCKTQVIEIVEV